MDSASQTKKILQWLQKGRKITQAEAIELFGCYRLSGRIYDIKDMGFDVRATMIQTKQGKRFAQYSL